jgi:hypothetical protein
MPWWIWLLVAFGGLVALASIWYAFQSPKFYGRILGAIYKALRPNLLKLFRPASQDKLEEWYQRIERGEDWGLPGQRKRPKE